MYVYVNGAIVPEHEAKISIFDHGFMYGLGVFETFRLYEGHPFLLDNHLYRLQKGLKALNIRLDLTKEKVISILTKLGQANGVENAYIRFNVSAGSAPLGLSVAPFTEPNVIVYMKPIDAPFARAKRGEILNVRRNTPEGAERLKSHHFLNNVIGRREIGDRLDVEGIFLTEVGHVAEGVVSNIFWVKDDQVFTPAVGTGILNGVTRQFILTLLEKLDIPFEEGYYHREELVRSDYAFMTNSIQEIVTLTDVDGQSFTSETPIIHQLRLHYEQYKKSLWSRFDIKMNERGLNEK